VNDKIYVNGQLANTKPAAGKLNSTGRPLGMGGNPVEGGQYFNGALDGLEFTTSRSPAESSTSLQYRYIRQQMPMQPC
jgi:hypothetical protein